MRKLNLRFLAGLTVTGLVLGAGVVGMHELQARRSAGWLLKRAETAETKGDLKQAQTYLERYLAYRPTDDQALARYAQLLDQTAQTPRERLRAVLALEQALRRQPDREDLRLRIAELDLALDRPTDAQWHLEILRKNQPDDGELESLTAQALVAERKYAEAAPWYDKAIEHDPSRIEASVELADLYRSRLSKPTRADAVMDRLVSTNARSAPAYLARWRYRKAHGLEGAAEDAKQAESLEPENPEVILAVAAEAMSQRDLETARQILTRGESQAPQEARIYQVRASLEREAGNTDAAVEALERGLQAVKDGAVGLRWDLVNLLIDTGQSAEAARALAEMERSSSLAPALRNYARARLPMADRHWAQAEPELEKARPALAEVPVWANHLARLDLDLAFCAERLGSPDRRIAALRRVAEASPESRNAGQLLAEALASSGQTERAIAAYQRLVVRDPDSWPALGRLLLNRVLREPPDRRNFSALDQALAQAERAQPGSVEVTILRAETLVARGQTEAARTLLEATRQAHPDRVEPWVSLALLDRQHDREGALRLLDEAQNRLGDHVEIALVRLMIAHSDPDRAQALPQVEALEATLPKWPQADRRTLGIALANARSRLGQNAEAQRLWDRLAREYPDDLEIGLVRLDRALRSGDDPRIEQALGEVQKIEGPGGDLGAFGQARWWILKARKGQTQAIEKARALLDRLARSRPDWPPLVLARAEIDDLAGDREPAMNGYLRAFDLGLRSTEACRRAVELLSQAGRFDEADRLVRALEEQAPLTGDLRRLASGLALQQHDSGRALETARQAVEEGSQDPKDHLWLARVLWATDHKTEVEPVLRQALTLDPKAPEPRLALVDYLMAVERQDEARALLDEAAETLKSSAPLALALGFERLGDGGRALELANQALAARPDDDATLRDAAALEIRLGQPEAAEPLLRRLMDRDASASSAWARRTLARLRARGGDYRRSEEALALLGPVSRESPLEDQRTRALILAGQAGRPHRDEAIRLLEEVLRQSSNRGSMTVEALLLAQLLDEAGRWLDAQPYLLKVLEADPANIPALAYYTRALLKRDKPAQARHYLDRLKQADPQSLLTAELEARVLSAEGRGTEAVAVIQAAVRDREPALQVQGAAVLEDFGQMGASEAMLRRLSQPPDGPGPLALARFLGHQGRIEEALAVCDQVRAQSEPLVFATTCEALMQRPEATEAQRQRVRLWLQDAIQQHPDQPALLTRLGVLQGFQGQYNEAEQSYRRALSANPHDTVALNNLAWLLALQGGTARAREALALVQRAIAQIGPHPELLDTQTVAYLAAERGDLAVETIRQAVERAPSPPFYFHQTRAYQAIRDSRAAAAAFHKATAAGLKVEDLHPLEQPVYLKMAIDLAGR